MYVELEEMRGRDGERVRQREQQVCKRAERKTRLAEPARDPRERRCLGGTRVGEAAAGEDVRDSDGAER
jgi:hypothetical protein